MVTPALVRRCPDPRGRPGRPAPWGGRHRAAAGATALALTARFTCGRARHAPSGILPPHGLWADRLLRVSVAPSRGRLVSPGPWGSVGAPCRLGGPGRAAAPGRAHTASVLTRGGLCGRRVPSPSLKSRAGLRGPTGHVPRPGVSANAGQVGHRQDACSPSLRETGSAAGQSGAWGQQVPHTGLCAPLLQVVG